MKRVGLLLLFSFLIFGVIIGNFVIADENDSRSGSDSEDDSNSVISVRDNSGSSDDEDENETEIEDEADDEDENEVRIRERIREITTAGNCIIKTERKIRIENGRSFEEFERKIKCANGREEEIKIRVENRTEDGRFRESIRYEIRGEEIEVEAEDEIDLEEQTNGTEYRLRARLRNGDVTDIKIMPDTASEIALERLKALNFTIELKEIRERNIPRVVYNIETNKHGRFLGVFKLAIKVEGEVDPETGEFIGTSKPWWAFLVTGEDSDQTNGEDETEEEKEITVGLAEENDSNQSGTATLVESGGQVTVTLNITGFVEGISQPAHIHNGSCPDVGAVKYPLSSVLNGISETTINATFDQLEDELPLAINVHKSAGESSVYVSCGDLDF
ncbi:MAG: hypothetical protein Q8P79_02160 [Nanoarchaeota archaeon]|nr:hypothetical protein [Nanoarchaeota archaeon]